MLPRAPPTPTARVTAARSDPGVANVAALTSTGIRLLGRSPFNDARMASGNTFGDDVGPGFSGADAAV